MRLFWNIVKRDLRLSWRQGGGAVVGVAFFMIAVCLFPFGVGSQAAILAQIGPGIIWVCALLAALLSLEQLFQDDFQDGGLDLLLLADMSLERVVFAKCLANWLFSGVPILIVAPFLGIMLQMEMDALPGLVAALALGTPSLSLIGAVGAALTLGARRGGALLALLVLPLQIPVLVFGAGAVEAALNAQPMGVHLAVLTALLVGLAPLCLWASAAALRVAGE